LYEMKPSQDFVVLGYNNGFVVVVADGHFLSVDLPQGIDLYDVTELDVSGFRGNGVIKVKLPNSREILLSVDQELSRGVFTDLQGNLIATVDKDAPPAVPPKAGEAGAAGEAGTAAPAGTEASAASEETRYRFPNGAELVFKRGGAGEGGARFVSPGGEP